MSELLTDIVKQFAVNAAVRSYGNGHIHDTYVVEGEPKYLLQRINHTVFRRPFEVMTNIVGVTEFLRGKIAAEGGDPERETLTVIRTRDGESCYRSAEGNYYRMFRYIEGTLSYERVESPEQLYAAARTFGRFQRLLSDYPADTLYDTIPHFHDTPRRFRDLLSAAAEDRMGRAAAIRPEMEFILARESEMATVTDALADGRVPLRVTHNDTKLNNVLLDTETGEGVCVIDLDTVMPGSLLYDYGDALRFGASTGAEDERDLHKISFDIALFEAFTSGFLAEVGDTLTPTERALLPFSAKLMTLECGMRFLTDYLVGDTYFKIHREHHNLDRARTQLCLVADIEAKLPKMERIVKKYV